jgi:hypothetical protein
MWIIVHDSNSNGIIIIIIIIIITTTTTTTIISVQVAKRSAHMVLDRSSSGNVDSNFARGMDGCSCSPRFSVLCCLM